MFTFSNFQSEASLYVRHLLFVNSLFQNYKFPRANAG